MNSKYSLNSNLKIICFKSHKTWKTVPLALLHLLMLYKIISFFSHKIVLVVMNTTHLPENPSRYNIHAHFLEHPTFQSVQQMPLGEYVGETTAATVDWYEPAEPTDRELEHPISCRRATHTGISHLSLLSTSLQGRP